MMREHSYMEMSLRGSELGKCESYGNWRNLCVLVGTRTQKQKFGRCVTFSDKIRRCRSVLFLRWRQAVRMRWWMYSARWAQRKWVSKTGLPNCKKLNRPPFQTNYSENS